ncbi:adenosine deaminase [Propionimicrobium sp. PCR01-08-3]|uniref:adenosine deaminase n=1 Tax=Propionimicrobium sp. PCR01-08-3 TaxID=3052086 RepID=UPI00255C68A1|nr:adenosine deaminase [Propionimicrobium sp. PCR01-08-3]WIY82152.1 adenosine deaminase [Propionimicrobium sp. PCR01-08-3]
MASVEFFRNLPKVSLHDHLDGGLRPQTMIEIADEIGHRLPASSADELGDWFFATANSGSLAQYLTTFDHTTACMQRADDLRRVAREWVADQVADGVVAGEARWAPEQHLRAGLSLDEAVEAVGEGLREGIAEAETSGKSFIAGQIVTAMRHAGRAVEIAELALRHRDSDLVTGFDIAGGEQGNPPAKHLAAFQLLRENDFPYTIHAGEEGPLESMHEAVQTCGALRIGHGVGIVKDITRNQTTGRYQLGRFARFVRDQQIPLEICPSSNLQTGVASEMKVHPIGTLIWLGFNVTLNCDNRLVSNTTLSREYSLVSEAFGLSTMQMSQIALAGASALFLDHAERTKLVQEMTLPWFQSSVNERGGGVQPELWER